MNEIYTCRVCGSKNISNIGALAGQTYFAGEALSKSFPRSFLYKCNNCLILLRNPIQNEDEYNELYANIESPGWLKVNKHLRNDQSLIQKYIQKKKSKFNNILDVGCFTGDLLVSLEGNYHKYGIEMSESAANVAKDRGIEIIGKNLYQIKTSLLFDVIVSSDVIEHTINPKVFIVKLMSLLNENGELIISTGNTDSWLWRILKNRFWYSSFPEHISFIGEKWLVKFCKENNYLIVESKFFKYLAFTPLLFIKFPIKLILSLLGVQPERLSNITQDHFYFVIKKNII